MLGKCQLQKVPGKTLTMAGGCDGSGLAHYVARCLCSNVKWGVGSESLPSSAAFLLKNFDVGHLYRFVEESSQKGPCWKHNAVCKLKLPQPVTLFVAGFSCKLNSTMRADRWKSDPIDDSKREYQTFQGSLDFIHNTQPTFALLENVLGCMKRRSADTSDSPLDWYRQKFGQQLGNYTFADITVDSLPHPEQRARVFMLLSRCEAFSANAWKAEVEKIMETTAAMPIFAPDLSYASPTPPRCSGAEQEDEKVCDYHVLFAKAFKNLGMLSRMLCFLQSVVLRSHADCIVLKYSHETQHFF